MHKHVFVPRSPSLSFFIRICLLAGLLAGLLAAPVLAGLPEPEPYLVKDIYPGTYSSNPHELTAVGSKLFFVAYDEIHGFELWRSDGMGGNTELVKDIYSGKFHALPMALTNVNGTLFFSANDGIHGEELWRSDGTAAGTVLVKDISPGSGGSFSLFDDLVWVVDQDTLYFSADDGIHGEELWRSDGTEAGTQMIKDINPGVEDAFDPNYLRMISGDGGLFFIANDGAHGFELWQSDGSEAGTALVKDIYPWPGDSNWQYYLDWAYSDGTLFFSANDSTHGFELWRSDGTEAGTTLVNDIYPGGNYAYPQNLTVMHGVLFFSADDGTNGKELWRSDGSEVGTVMLKNINPVGNHSDPQNLTVVNGDLFFSANDGTNGQELWRSDGSEAGTALVKDINQGKYGSSPWELVEVNGTIYFSAYDDPHGEELWRSDGTSEGTRMVMDLDPGSFDSYPRYLTNVDGKLFFSANNSLFDDYYYRIFKAGGYVNEPVGFELWSLGYFTYMPVLGK